MVRMERIQGLSLGHQNWQRPVFPMMLGQDGNGNGGPAPAPAPGPAPSPGPGPTFPVFPQPIYPPVYTYPVITEPPVAAGAPNWALIAGGLAAGIVLTLLLT